MTSVYAQQQQLFWSLVYDLSQSIFETSELSSPFILNFSPSVVITAELVSTLVCDSSTYGKQSLWLSTYVKHSWYHLWFTRCLYLQSWQLSWFHSLQLVYICSCSLNFKAKGPLISAHILISCCSILFHQLLQSWLVHYSWHSSCHSKPPWYTASVYDTKQSFL